MPPFDRSFFGVSPHENNHVDAFSFVSSKNNKTLQAAEENNKTLQAAEDGMLEGCLRAVLMCLTQNGLSVASVDELNENLKRAEYLEVMQRSQEYAQCIVSSSASLSDGSRRQVERQRQNRRTLLFVLVQAWESLCRYTAMQHRKANLRFSRLRTYSAASATATAKGKTRRQGNQQQHALVVELEQAEKKQLQQTMQRALYDLTARAELCCAAQKGWILAQAWERRLLT